jgi:hypothetical protein
MAAIDNKTLRTKCASCGKELPTDVDADLKQRKTWPLVGECDGAKQVFPACTDCFKKGWRPQGYVDSAVFGAS